MLRFTIRDTILVTTIIAILLAWWLDRGNLSKHNEANRKWQIRAEYIRDRWNGTKLGGKWMTEYRLDFSPDDSAGIYFTNREAGGEWVVPNNQHAEWTLDWANVR